MSNEDGINDWANRMAHISTIWESVLDSLRHGAESLAASFEEAGQAMQATQAMQAMQAMRAMARAFPEEQPRDH